MELSKSPYANDPNNSSSANLGPGETFTGGASVSMGGGVITIFLHTDQILSCTLYIEQSADAINWDHLLTFQPDADAMLEGNSESWSVRSLADYYRIRITNNSAFTTTYFRLATRLAINGNGAVSLLVDDDGHPIEATQDFNGEYNLGVAMLQKVLASRVNNYGSNLTVGAIFYGTAESTLGVAGIQTTLNADQNCTVFVQQSGNGGTNWDINDTYAYNCFTNGTQKGQSWTTQAVGDTYRVNIKNTGSAATTFLRTFTALCPVVEAVPRALSQNGNFKVAVNELVNTFGEGVMGDPVGQLRTTQTTRLVGASFGPETTLDTNFWGSTAVGTGTIVSGGNMVSINTGAVSASSGTLQSTRTGRKVGGTANYYRGNVRVPSTTGANRRRWGAYSATDGFFFEWDGSNLTLVCRKGGSDTNRVVNGNFNGNFGNSYALNSNAHTYEIYWTQGKTWFQVDDDILHTFAGLTAPLTNTSSLPSAAENANAAGNTNANSLEVRSASISRLGPYATAPLLKNISANTTATVLKYGPGVLHRIITNTLGGNGELLMLYDGLFPSTVASWGTLNIGASTTLPASTREYMAPFYTGLTIVMGTASAADVVIIYE